MKKVAMICSCFVLALGLAVAADPTAKEIMSAGNKGKDSLCAKINAGAKAEKWDDAAAAAKTFAEHGAALAKAEPKRGDKESWAKLAKAYGENTAAIAKAVEKKDAKGVADGIATLQKSCKACHDAHK